MEKRQLGTAGPSITALGYGAMELRQVDEAGAGRLLNAVLDGGITYIDTAPDYGPSEMYIGNTIAHRRNEYILASKCGCNIDANGTWLEPRHLWTRQRLLQNVENSLRLLKTDHIDVWQLHGPLPEEMPGGRTDEVIRTMEELKQQGKVRRIGISFQNGPATHPLHPAGFAFVYAPQFMNWGVFDVMQIVYGGLVRQDEDIISQGASQGIGIIVRGVVKKYRDNFDQLFASARLHELCAQGESSSDFLIRFALSHPGISTMIIGTKNVDHVAANIKAAGLGKLPADVYAEAKRRLDAIGVGIGK